MSPRTHTEIEDIRTLSPQERALLVLGSTIQIFVGAQYVDLIPLDLLIAISEPKNGFYLHTHRVASLWLAEGVGCKPILHILHWLESVIKSSITTVPELAGLNDMLDDLVLCRAARHLGLREIYYTHIRSPYWENVQNCSLLPAYIDMAAIDSIALDNEDPLLLLLASRLAEMRHKHKIKDMKEFRHFLTLHPRLKRLMARFDRPHRKNEQLGARLWTSQDNTRVDQTKQRCKTPQDMSAHDLLNRVINSPHARLLKLEEAKLPKH